MKNKIFSYILLSGMALLSLNLSTKAQNVIIADDDSFWAHSSAMLHVKSLNKGLLIPQLTEAQRNAIVTPAEGLLIYQTNNNPGIYIYQSGWKLLGSDLGTHTATQNLMLNNYWLSNDGDDEGIAVDDSGNVGIGISTPAANLHIAGDGRIRLDQSSSYAWDINAGAGGFSVEEVSPNAGTRLLIDNTGNVGIGTSSPNFNLEVEGSISANAYYGVESNDYIEIDDAENFKFFTNNAERMRLAGSGFLGIGLSVPAYMLDVNGSVTSRSADGFRLRQPTYSTFLRNDGHDFFILLTDADNPDGGFNTLRPFRIWLDEGHVSLGNHALFVQHGGNVGIGTTNPTSKLEIAGGNIDINDNTLYIKADPNSTFGIGYNVEGGEQLTIFSDRFIDFTESDNHGNIMRIDANAGKVGIGTLNPTAKLSVQATAATGDTLFAVKDQDGNNVFVVYPDAVQVIVPTDTKDGKSNKKGAFLVSGRGSNKSEANFMDMTKENSIMGYEAAPIVTGTRNSIVGFNAGHSLSSGDNNVIIGDSAGYNTTTGGLNVFIGNGAGYSNSNGGANCYVGNYAGCNSNGSGNSFFGSASGANSTGMLNTYFGYLSGLNNTNGNFNTIYGSRAGENSTGSYNTFVGMASGYNSTSSNSVFIGYQAGFNETNSNRLYIDNSSTTTPLLWGDFANNKLVINGNSSHNSNNRTFYSNGSAGGSSAWNNDSDRKLKTEIRTITNSLEKVLNLRGVNYKWKDGREEGTRMGFIAQEANEVIPEVVTEGETYSMQYAPVTALLVEAIKEQQQQIDAKNQENEELKESIQELNKRIEMIEEYLNNKKQ
jgi:hypothetical protein